MAIIGGSFRRAIGENVRAKMIDRAIGLFERQTHWDRLAGGAHARGGGPREEGQVRRRHHVAAHFLDQAGEPPLRSWSCIVKPAPVPRPGIAGGPKTTAVASGIWREVGWESIVFLAAVSGINPELYDVADIDGAGTNPGLRFDQFQTGSATVTP